MGEDNWIDCHMANPRNGMKRKGWRFEGQYSMNTEKVTIYEKGVDKEA